MKWWRDYESVELFSDCIIGIRTSDALYILKLQPPLQNTTCSGVETPDLGLDR